jgi:hypothetical protein
MIVSRTGALQDLNTIATNGESNNINGQTTFNEVRIYENCLNK